MESGRGLSRFPLVHVKPPRVTAVVPALQAAAAAVLVLVTACAGVSAVVPALGAAPGAWLVLSTPCAGVPPRALDLPPPKEVTTLGPGDVFEIHIVGEDKLPTTFTVSPDGSADLPYVKRVQAAGL